MDVQVVLVWTVLVCNANHDIEEISEQHIDSNEMALFNKHFTNYGLLDTKPTSLFWVSVIAAIWPNDLKSWSIPTDFRELTAMNVERLHAKYPTGSYVTYEWKKKFGDQFRLTLR